MVVLFENQMINISFFTSNTLNLKAMNFKTCVFSISLLFLTTAIISSCTKASIEDEIGIDNEKDIPIYKTSKDELEER
ncbi:hypothetical protein GCM10007384_13200 [Aquimarina muelleri]|uniref:Uncharacterized protein n=1 Tax=Aquimarina muelleri TaxID=279356 RepID=A0A918N1Q4_9FLAO|nr:hypothetical protein GCM10007384_13200 [Aquimarina muelleri]